MAELQRAVLLVLMLACSGCSNERDCVEFATNKAVYCVPSERVLSNQLYLIPMRNGNGQNILIGRTPSELQAIFLTIQSSKTAPEVHPVEIEEITSSPEEKIERRTEYADYKTQSWSYVMHYGQEEVVIAVCSKLELRRAKCVGPAEFEGRKLVALWNDGDGQDPVRMWTRVRGALKNWRKSAVAL